MAFKSVCFEKEQTDLWGPFLRLMPQLRRSHDLSSFRCSLIWRSSCSRNCRVQCCSSYCTALIKCAGPGSSSTRMGVWDKRTRKSYAGSELQQPDGSKCSFVSRRKEHSKSMSQINLLCCDQCSCPLIWVTRVTGLGKGPTWRRFKNL